MKDNNKGENMLINELAQRVNVRNDLINSALAGLRDTIENEDVCITITSKRWAVMSIVLTLNEKHGEDKHNDNT